MLLLSPFSLILASNMSKVSVSLSPFMALAEGGEGRRVRRDSAPRRREGGASLKIGPHSTQSRQGQKKGGGGGGCALYCSTVMCITSGSIRTISLWT